MERLSSLYASALFDLAVERDMLDESLQQAQFLHDSLQDAQTQRLLLHPHISGAEKRTFLNNALKSHIHDDFLGFLNLAIEKNREAYIVPALDSLISLIEKRKNIVIAKVISASDIDPEQIAALEETLSKQLRKHVRLSLKIDTSIIAGPYIFVDGYYLDWTFKKRISDLAVHMKEGCTA